MKRFQIGSLILSFLVLLFLTSAGAQDKVSDKLKEVKGKVQKITVQTDNGEVIFEGKEAQKLFKDLQGHEKQVKVHITSDGDKLNKKKKVIILNKDDSMLELEDDADVFIMKDMDEDFEWEVDGGSQKKIVLTVEDGNKKVVVTTKENGKEKIDVYEGEEAEKYLEEHKGKHLDIKIENCDEDKKVKKIIIEKESEEDKN